MDDTPKKKNDTWYIKKLDKVSGPFPVKLIGSYLILGRIDLDTLVSPDRDKWIPVGRLPSLIPEELKVASTTEGKAALHRAKLREDERRGDTRREEKEDRRVAARNEAERRQIRERRENPEEISSAYQHIRQDLNREEAREKTVNRTGAILLILVALGVLASFFLLDPVEKLEKADCNAAPKPGVDWGYCNKTGIDLSGKDLTAAKLVNANLTNANLSAARLAKIDLSYANLTSANLEKVRLKGAKLVGTNFNQARMESADLTDADLSYADLRGAVLDGAKVRGARFGNAIWADGTRCAAGSIGGCIPAK